MAQLLTTIVPLLAFMLTPVWIPILAVAAGALVDRVRTPRPSPAAAAVERAKQRSAANRGAAPTAVPAAVPAAA